LSKMLIKKVLYPTHIPTSPIQKGLIGIFSAFKALNNPHRADAIASLGETTGYVALKRLRNKLISDKDGLEILKNRPLITNETLISYKLHELPKDTFGGAYYDFLKSHGYHPDERNDVHYIDDEELAYIMLRYRQTHDFAHVLCGLPTTVLGELGLKWFESVQTGLPMCIISSLFGPLNIKDNKSDLIKLNKKLIPWALKNGYNAKPFITIQFEKELKTPLNELREKLNIKPAPSLC